MEDYEFAKLKKKILLASKADPPRIGDLRRDEEFVRFEVPVQPEWLGEYDTLGEMPPGESQSVAVRPVNRVVSWYEHLIEAGIDRRHLHVDLIDVDGEVALEVRCKYEWAEQYVHDERTEASFVSQFSKTLGPPGTNERNDTSASPWHDVEEVPVDLREEDLE